MPRRISIEGQYTLHKEFPELVELQKSGTVAETAVRCTAASAGPAMDVPGLVILSSTTIAGHSAVEPLTYHWPAHYLKLQNGKPVKEQPTEHKVQSQHV